MLVQALERASETRVICNAVFLLYLDRIDLKVFRQSSWNSKQNTKWADTSCMGFIIENQNKTKG